MSIPQRIEQRFGVSIHVGCAMRDMWVTHRATNISRGGLFMEGRSLPIDSDVQLRLHLAEHEVIELQARVVWNYDIKKGASHQVRGMGMKFVGLSVEELRRLNAYLKKIGPKPAVAASETSH